MRSIVRLTADGVRSSRRPAAEKLPVSITAANVSSARARSAPLAIFAFKSKILRVLGCYRSGHPSPICALPYQSKGTVMEYRQLGSSGLRIPALSFGTGTFGGRGPLFSAWGQSGARDPRRLIDICLEAGVTLFDTADVYSNGASEEILGDAIKGRRDKVLISTKTGLPMGDDPSDWGVSRARLIRAVEDALRRLATDHIDLLQLHAFDTSTPVDELMETLGQLIATGKLRYAGVSNYPGWQLMKAQAFASQHGLPRFVAHQVYYSLIGRAYEADLMPLAADQGIGALVWSPLGWGRLTGKIGRGRPVPEGSRLHETEQFAPPVEREHLYRVIDALESIAAETGKTVSQIAI